MISTCVFNFLNAKYNTIKSNGIPIVIIIIIHIFLSYYEVNYDRLTTMIETIVKIIIEYDIVNRFIN